MAERLTLPKGMQPSRELTTEAGIAVVKNRLVVPRTQLDVHDTTLRDGGQKNLVNFGVEGKLVVARRIDETLRPDVIEAGWPGANPVDTEVFNKLKKEPLTHAKLSSFGMTVAPYKNPEDDQQIQHQIDAAAPIKTIVGKADIYQVIEGLKKPREENLRMIEDTMEYMKADPDTEQVRFDAEHFFSGFRTDPGYALDCIRAAAKGGADMVVLCDTMGDAMPEDVELAMQTVLGDETLNVEYAKHHPGSKNMPVGIHAHNDNGLALAHSLSAIRLGASSVQGTVTGIGERAGNADIQTLMTIRTRKYGTEDIPEENLGDLKDLSMTVATRAGVEIDPDQPYTGDNAFNHKGGLHTAFVLATPPLYEHDEPEIFGNKRKIPVSAQNGAAGIKYNLELLDLPFKVDKTFAVALTDILKDRDRVGYDYERAHASFDLLARRQHPDYTSPFTIKSHEDNTASLFNNAEAVVGKDEPPVQVPVSTNAELMFDTITGKLADKFDALNGVNVVSSYSKRKNGHIAVYITAADGVKEWTTVGVAEHTDKQLATLEAVVDAIEYGLYYPRATSIEA